ncbi:MAG: hypothetical protein NXY59_09455 [Aigarchaeota archaeon]|nr:hypothetical protein [Candidatus Pelearchaeum maunauluense]
MNEIRYKQIPQVLAVLAHGGDYHYIDRLGYTHSKPLVMYYLREAIRAFHALKRSPPKEMPNAAAELMQSINPNYLEYEVEQINNVEKTKELREAVSLICAKALAIALKFIERGD